MIKQLLTLFTFGLILSGSSCIEKDAANENAFIYEQVKGQITRGSTHPSANTGGTGSGSSGVNCGSGYAGPKNDPQIDAFCEQAYVMICTGGYDKNSSQVKQVCKLYAEMRQLNPSYPSCPYCN